MELIPAHKLPMILYSDFMANLAIFGDFMCMENQNWRILHIRDNIANAYEGC